MPSAAVGAAEMRRTVMEPAEHDDATDVVVPNAERVGAAANPPVEDRRRRGLAFP